MRQDAFDSNYTTDVNIFFHFSSNVENFCQIKLYFTTNVALGLRKNSGVKFALFQLSTQKSEGIRRRYAVSLMISICLNHKHNGGL